MEAPGVLLRCWPRFSIQKAPEVEEYREWLGGKFDLEAFSLVRRNREVQRLHLVPRQLIDVQPPRAWQW